MRSRVRRRAFAAWVAAIGMSVATVDEARANATEDAGDDAMQALIVERCTRCHVLDTVTARRATPKEWREIIERMVMQGAQVAPDEIETIVSYLAKHHGSESPVDK
jgi:cytochrome c2